MDKVTGQCPQTTTFLKRKESRSGIEPRTFRLPTWRLTAMPNRLTLGCLCLLELFSSDSVSKAYKKLIVFGSRPWCYQYQPKLLGMERSNNHVTRSHEMSLNLKFGSLKYCMSQTCKFCSLFSCLNHVSAAKSVDVTCSWRLHVWRRPFWENQLESFHCALCSFFPVILSNRKFNCTSLCNP